MSKEKKGLFIIVEGPEASGKTTIINFIKKYFEKINVKSFFTKEPGGTEFGEKIRSAVLDTENGITPEAILLAMYASRHNLINKIIIPKLKEVDFVVCDRWVESSFVYQGYGQDVDFGFINRLNTLVVNDFKPDFRIITKIDFDKLMERKKLRNNIDHFEVMNEEFFKRVYGGYIDIYNNNPSKYLVIDTNGTLQQIEYQVVVALTHILATKLEQSSDSLLDLQKNKVLK